jgi:hypothetical protein
MTQYSDSSVGWVAKKLWFCSWQGQVFFTSLEFLYWVWSPLTLLVARVMGGNFPWCKVAMLKAGHSVSFSAEDRNALSNISMLAHATEA